MVLAFLIMTIRALTVNIWFEDTDLETRMVNLVTLIVNEMPEIVTLQEVRFDVWSCFQKCGLGDYYEMSDYRVMGGNKVHIADDTDNTPGTQALASAGTIESVNAENYTTMMMIKKSWVSRTSRTSRTSQTSQAPQIRFIRLPLGSLMSRDILYTVIGGVAYITTHLESTYGLAAIRRRQLDQILQHFTKKSMPYVILGDLNLNGKECLDLLIKYDVNDVWKSLHPDKDGYTYDSTRNPYVYTKRKFRARYDRVLTGGNAGENAGEDAGENVKVGIRAIEIELIDQPLMSDHFGLMCTLSSSPL